MKAADLIAGQLYVRRALRADQTRRLPCLVIDNQLKYRTCHRIVTRDGWWIVVRAVTTDPAFGRGKVLAAQLEDDGVWWPVAVPPGHLPRPWDKGLVRIGRQVMDW